MFCTIKFVYYKSFCVRDDIGSYIRTVYHMVSHTPKRGVGSSNLFWDAKTGRLVRRSEGAFHKPPAFFTLRRMMQAGPLRSVIRASRMDALHMR